MIATSSHARPLNRISDGDRQLQAAARDALSTSKYVALRQLNCRVAEGDVEISGTVSSFYLKQVAQAAMQRLNPAGHVRNLVEVTRKRNA